MKDVQSNPCAACPGHCCSRNVINVCGYDAWVIARGLEIPPMDFLAFARLEEETPYDFRLDGSGAAYHLALNMNLHGDGIRRCIFGIMLPRGQFRCGIYPLRPLGCRSYPFTFDEEGPAVKPWALCPAEWEPDAIRIESVREDLARSDMEFCIYGRIVAVWNRGVSGHPPMARLDFRPFVRYLMDTYDRLGEARAEIPLEAWPVIWACWRDYIAKKENPLELNSIPPNGSPLWKRWLEDIHHATRPAPQSNPIRSGQGE